MADAKKPQELFTTPWTLDALPEGDSPAGISDSGDGAATPAAADDTGGETPADPTPPAGPQVETDLGVPPAPLRIVEAMLFIGGAPLTEVRACEAIRGLTSEQFRQFIDELNRQYRRQGRPFHVRPQDQGYVLTLRPAFRTVEDRLNGALREARLSQAAIDALSLVAYRQPATKQEIDAVRGSDSGNLLRQLLRRGLIALERGQADQQEVSYCTTRRFLELFHLKSLDDLPQTQDLQRI